MIWAGEHTSGARDAVRAWMISELVMPPNDPLVAEPKGVSQGSWRQRTVKQRTEDGCGLDFDVWGSGVTS